MTLDRWFALAVGLGLLAVVVIAARRAWQRGDGLGTALGLYCLVWGIALVLFAIPWVRYTTTPVRVWLLIYGSIATFTIGALIAERRYRRMSRVEPAQRQRPDARRLRLTWIAFALMGLFGFAAFVHAVDVVLGWHALIRDPASVRDIQSTSVNFSDTYGLWKLLTYCNQIAFVLWTLGLRERAFEGRWRAARVLGPLSLVPFVFTGDRTLMLFSLVWAACFHLLYRPSARLRRVGIGAVASIVALVLVFGLLGGRVGKTISSHPEVARALTTRSVDSLALPYVYVTANPPTFAGLVKDPLRPHTDGQLTFLPAVKILHGLGLWGQPPEVVGAFYAIPFQTFNNYSWLGTFYTDFGAIGCLLLPFLIAYLTTAVVIRAVRKRTLLSIWTASLLLYCVAFTPTLPKFSDTLTWEYLLVGPLVVALIREDLGPREVIRRWRLLGQARPRLAIGVTLAAVGIASLALVGLLSARSTATLARSQGALSSKLRTAARWAGVTRVADVYPTSIALASRLHAHDPGTRYVALAGADETAADPQTIGVFTAGGRLVFRAESSQHNFVTFDSSSLGSKLKVAPGGLAPLRKELVVNGGFEDGYGEWQVRGGGIARAALVRSGYKGGRAVAVSGTGAGGASLVFEQAVHVHAPRGACFSFSVQSRSRRLSRPLLVWASLLHSNGSTDQLILGRRHLGLGPGSGGWRRFRVAARATAPVQIAVVFGADSGVVPLTGTAYIDDVSLRRTC